MSSEYAQNELASDDISGYLDVCRMVNLGMLGMSFLYPDLKKIKLEAGFIEKKEKQTKKRASKILSREFYISQCPEAYDAPSVLNRLPQKARIGVKSDLESTKLLYLLERALKELRQKGYNIWRE